MRALSSASFVVFALFVACILSFVDRQIIGLLLQPMRADLGLTDIEMSLVTGFAFALTYATLGLVMGYAADRLHRRNLILAGVAVWMLATAGTSLVTGLAGLAVARCVLACGEAALGPAAYSIIADCYPPERRALPVSIYSAGVTVGSAAALLLGGFVMGALAPETDGRWAPWRLAYLVAAAPGLLVLLLIWLIDEPVRTAGANDRTLTLGSLRDFVQNSELLLCILGFATMAIVTYNLAIWVPTVFAREWAWSTAKIGQAYGLIVLLLGVGGIVLAGWLGNRWRHAHVLMAIMGGSGVALAALLLWFVATAEGSLVAVAMATFCLSFPIGLGPTVVIAQTAPAQRGRVIAFATLCITLVGLGLGPTLVALVERWMAAGASGLRMALAASMLAASVTSVLLLSVSHIGRRKHVRTA